jgi:hypothetical protein
LSKSSNRAGSSFLNWTRLGTSAQKSLRTRTACLSRSGAKQPDPIHPSTACPQKGNAMLARLNDRLKQLEAKVAPKGRHFVFTHFVDDEGPVAPSRDEQLADKTEHGIAPSDIIHEVKVAFS